MKLTKFKVDMHCASCSVAIERQLKNIGIEEFQINVALKILKVKHSDLISTEDIIQSIKKAGYNATKA